MEKKIEQLLLDACKIALMALMDHPDLHFGTKEFLKKVIARAEAEIAKED